MFRSQPVFVQGYQPVLRSFQRTGGGGGDPYFANVTLLCHMDGTNGSTTFPDNSNSAHSITANGNAQVSTTAPEFGTGSLLLDGTGDYLSMAQSNDFAFGTGDFTVEFWMKSTASGSDASYLAIPDNGSNNWALLYTGGEMYWMSHFGITYLFHNTASGLYDGAWHAVAIVRSSGTIKMYYDGTAKANTASDSTNYAASIGLRIGDSAGFFTDFNGSIDELRITKGVARYTTNYTPAGPFPNS